MIWKMPIDENGGNAIYDPEIKERHVVACGWPRLGNLTCLYQACHAGHLTWQQVRPLLEILAEDYMPVGQAFYNSFHRLLCDFAVGDIVIAYVGYHPVGICEICDCFTYLYDDSYDYAHCLFGVDWVDWADFVAFVANHGGPDVDPGHHLVAGIVQNNVHVPNIQQEWEAYRAVYMPARPCSQETLNRCQELIAQAPIDCVDQLAYWRSIPMYREIERALERKKQIILYGPPGTGKTYLAKQFVRQHWNLPDNRSEVVQFHPAYNYEDFVRGVQVRTVEGEVQYDMVHRVFSEMCKAARDDPNNKYLLIIDEINRANLAAVLGELIYALEYRGEPVRTPYKLDGTFGLVVPNNLYIIGTMNTADRSIGHIDYAVRRRFAFLPMAPNADVIGQVVPEEGGLRASALLLFNAIRGLFHGENRALSADFFADDVQPGHSYFLATTCEALLMDFVYQMLPLLHEYVKDGVLKQDAKLALGNLSIPLKGLNAKSPEQWAEQIKAILPCLQQQATPPAQGQPAAPAEGVAEPNEQVDDNADQD